MTVGVPENHCSEYGGGKLYLPKYLILLSFLLISALPSLSEQQFLQWGLAGLDVDINLYQAIILTFSLYGSFAWFKTPLSMTFKWFFLIFCLMVSYNTFSILIFHIDYVVPTLRGIFNLFVNLLCVFLISQVLRRYISVRGFSLTVVVFGNILAFSGIAEFALLQFSDSALEQWRRMIVGNTSNIKELLTLHGVALDLHKLSRVGGLIGAPENLGNALTLTLPFALLANLTVLGQMWIIIIYTIVSVFTSSRSLGIALILHLIFLISCKYRGIRTVGPVVAGAIGLCGVLWFGLNLESFSRFSSDAFSYEWVWRGAGLAGLLEAIQESGMWFTGLGFGWGSEAQFGLTPLTSGVLGGDIAIAFGLGGLPGVAILAVLWVLILKIKKVARSVSPGVRAAVNLYMLFIALRSLITPELMRLVLVSNILTLLLLSFIVVADYAVNYSSTESLKDDIFDG